MKTLQNIREVLKTLKHSKPTQIYCPRCASPKINLFSSFDMWLTPKRYLCQNCGYMGTIVMELEKIEKNEVSNQAVPDSTASSKSYNDSEP